MEKIQWGEIKTPKKQQCLTHKALIKSVCSDGTIKDRGLQGPDFEEKGEEREGNLDAIAVILLVVCYLLG